VPKNSKGDVNETFWQTRKRIKTDITIYRKGFQANVI